MIVRNLLRLPTAITLALLLLLLAVACGGGSSDPGSTPGTASATPSKEPTPTTSDEPEVLPPLTPFGAELAAKLQSIQQKVSEIRGLPVPELKQEGVARPEDVLQNNQDYFEDITEEEQAEFDAWLTAMSMLKLVPDGYSIDDFATDYSSSIAGFYSIENKALVLIGEPDQTISVYDETVLAHEYAHALQDAAFDLGALQDKYTGYPDDEAGLTAYGELASCVYEGDATVTEYKYMEEVYGPGWLDEIEYEPSGQEGQSDGFPEFMQRAFGFDYNECYLFVDGLYEEGGWDAVNAAYKNLPATTEQILDPEKYKSGEVANGMMPEDLSGDILTGWTVSEIGQFGQFDVFNYILTVTGDYVAAFAAAEGWGSGWGRIYTSGTGSRVLQLQLSFDSREDLSEFVKAFGDVLREYGVDTSTLETSGVRHFTITGSPSYYGAIGSPNGGEAAEILLATDSVTLGQAAANLE